MEQSEIDDILAYLKGEGFPTAIVGFHGRYVFKRKCSNYSYKGTELYYDGRRVLNTSDAVAMVQQLHEDLDHMRGKNLAAAIQKHYEIRRLRQTAPRRHLYHRRQQKIRIVRIARRAVRLGLSTAP